MSLLRWRGEWAVNLWIFELGLRVYSVLTSFNLRMSYDSGVEERHFSWRLLLPNCHFGGVAMIPEIKDLKWSIILCLQVQKLLVGSWQQRGIDLNAVDVRACLATVWFMFIKYTTCAHQVKLISEISEIRVLTYQLGDTEDCL